MQTAPNLEESSPSAPASALSKFSISLTKPSNAFLAFFLASFNAANSLSISDDNKLSALDKATSISVASDPPNAASCAAFLNSAGLTLSFPHKSPNADAIPAS